MTPTNEWPEEPEVMDEPAYGVLIGLAGIALALGVLVFFAIVAVMAIF